MRIISMNLNGIRSATNKGFFSWLAKQDADVICLQEVRASKEHLDAHVLHPAGYHSYYACAQQKGYSGVAIYSKKKPDQIIERLGWPTADNEGRYLEAVFGDLHIASLYLPSGTSGEERQTIKFDFLDKYLTILQQQINQPRRYILCGDWNIAHTKMDIKNWRSNQNSSGFLPAERAWLDTLFNEVGFVDAYRHFNPDKIEYTWWSNRAKAWENNTGWRIDYQIVSPNLADKILRTEIYRQEKFSDHAPLIVDYALS